ncbi:MAG: hypothetical protein WCL37_04380 [Chrysiogenales bacterium]
MCKLKWIVLIAVFWVLICLSPVFAHQVETLDYWALYASYSIDRSGKLTSLVDPAQQCRLASSNPFGFYYYGPWNTEVLCSPSGQFAALPGIVPFSKNQHTRDWVAAPDDLCRQAPCDRALAVVDLKRCRIVSVLPYRELRNHCSHYFFSDDDSLLFISDNSLRVYAAPAFDRPLAEYRFTFASPMDLIEGVKRRFAGFSSGYCTMLTDHGWIVFNRADWKLAATNAMVLPSGVQLSVAERSGKLITNTGELLELFDPVWADGQTWVQFMRTVKQDSPQSVKRRAFLVTTLDYARDNYTLTPLPSDATEIRIEPGPEGELKALVIAKGKASEVVVQRPVRAGQQKGNYESVLFSWARRANAGDEEAEKVVIERLRLVVRETDETKPIADNSFYELIEAGNATLLAGTPKAMAAYAEALSSPKVYALDKRREAVAFLLLRVWWVAHPNAGTLREEFYDIFGGCQDAELFQTPPYQAYLRRLEVYFKEKYSMEVKFSAPFFMAGCPFD